MPQDRGSPLVCHGRRFWGKPSRTGNTSLTGPVNAGYYEESVVRASLNAADWVRFAEARETSPLPVDEVARETGPPFESTNPLKTLSSNFLVACTLGAGSQELLRSRRSSRLE